ncbi:Dynein regulatory complex protein 11, partial [Pseudolycoriella hygida]
MDSKFYGKLWVATCTDLQDVILREKVTRLQPQKTDSRKAHATFASIYVRYVSIVNALGDIYDQTLQVQKRGVVKVILTLATKRMLELQLDLKKIEMSEYMYFDQTLIEQKLIPTDVQLLTPFYYPMQRSDDIQGLLNGVRQFGESEEDSVQEPAKKTVKHLIEASKIISPEEQRKLDERKALVYAINVVISHEKARQSRNLHYNIKVHPKFYAKMLIPEVEAGPEYHFTFKEDQMPLFPVKRTDFGTNFYKVKRCFDDDSEFGGLSENKAKEENVKLFSTEIGTFTALDFVARLLRDINRNEAAVAIQRCYLKFQLRRAIKAKKLQHQHDLGMLELSRIDHTEEYEKMKEMREERRSKKKAFDRAFIQACEDDKARILRLRTPYIVEDITDHIRSWFREMYNAAGEFDTYPPEVKGGSILILRGETKTPSEFANFIAKRKKMTPEQIKK